MFRVRTRQRPVTVEAFVADLAQRRALRGQPGPAAGAPATRHGDRPDDAVPHRDPLGASGDDGADGLMPQHRRARRAAAARHGVQIASAYRGQQHPDERVPIAEFGQCRPSARRLRCPSTPRHGSHEPGPYPSGQPLDGVRSTMPRIMTGPSSLTVVPACRGRPARLRDSGLAQPHPAAAAHHQVPAGETQDEQLLASWCRRRPG